MMRTWLLTSESTRMWKASVLVLCYDSGLIDIALRTDAFPTGGVEVFHLNHDVFPLADQIMHVCVWLKIKSRL